MPNSNTEKKVVFVKLEDLKPADYNPRYITEWDFDHIKHSLEKFGFVVPLIVNSSSERMNIIIGGHQRWLVARKMGIKELPVVYLDLSLEKEKSLNVRLNKLGGRFDPDKLINHYDKDTLMDLGFTAKELDFMFQLNPGKEDEDVSPAVRNTPTLAFSLHFKSHAQQQSFIDWLTLAKLKQIDKGIADIVIEKMEDL